MDFYVPPTNNILFPTGRRSIADETTMGSSFVGFPKTFLACCSLCSAMSTARAFHVFPSQSAVPYVPPPWCSLRLPPHGRLQLAHMPTPLYRIDLDHKQVFLDVSAFKGINASLYIKRDDCTGGVELGGNKIRKLEFLLADALHDPAGYDAVVTIGGLQSNHCRATAAAARMVGLEPHLILRTPEADKKDVGMVGNVLLDRMVGSHIYTCTPGEYGRVGSDALVQRLCAYLEQRNLCKKAYPIPVGGSNAVGSWGYLKAVEELLLQWYNPDNHQLTLDHVVFACGSGGTAAGIFVGMALSHHSRDGYMAKPMPRLHAIGVCDDPDYFYRTVAHIVDNMGFVLPGDIMTDSIQTTEDYVRAHMTVHQGKNLGYAQSTTDELEFITGFCRASGVALDPVYSGKALYHFWNNIILKDPESFRNQSVLFWHTGGALGLYDKADEMTSMELSSMCERLDIYGKGNGVDVSK